MSTELNIQILLRKIVILPSKKLYKSAVNLEAPATKRSKSKKFCRFVELKMEQFLLDGIWMFNLAKL